MSHGHRHDALRILDAGPRGRLPQRDRRQGARRGRASAAEVGGWRLAPAQTRGTNAGTPPCQPLSQALSADPGAGELLAEAARADGLSDPTFSRAGRLGLEVWKAVTSW
jgi:hypothetical protein